MPGGAENIVGGVPAAIPLVQRRAAEFRQALEERGLCGNGILAGAFDADAPALLDAIRARSAIMTCAAARAVGLLSTKPLGLE
jgi:hypothetical protein